MRAPRGRSCGRDLTWPAMSLYRQAGRASGRTLAVAAVVACVVGLALGFALGRLLAPQPTLADKVADLRTKLAPAREGIELSATEYAQAVRNGRVVAPTEYSAAKADVQRAADALATSRADLRALGATEAAALERAVADLRAAVSRRADLATVRRLGVAASAQLRAARRLWRPPGGGVRPRAPGGGPGWGGGGGVGRPGCRGWPGGSPGPRRS